MNTHSFNWDEIRESNGLKTYKKYFKNGDSLRVYEDTAHPEDKERFKLICRLDDRLREYPCLNEDLLNKYCNLFLEEEEQIHIKYRGDFKVPESQKALNYAKYLVTRGIDKGYPLNNLGLQKTLYLAQKEYIKRTGKELFIDAIEAWKFGPCVLDVYYYYCGYGAMPIVDRYERTEMPSYIRDNKIALEVLNYAVDTIGPAKPWEINERFKAWELVFKEMGCGCVIDKRALLKEIKSEL